MHTSIHQKRSSNGQTNQVMGGTIGILFIMAVAYLFQSTFPARETTLLLEFNAALFALFQSALPTWKAT